MELFGRLLEAIEFCADMKTSSSTAATVAWLSASVDLVFGGFMQIFSDMVLPRSYHVLHLADAAKVMISSCVS